MTPELPPNVAVRPITERMVAIRGQNVILDSDLVFRKQMVYTCA